ncbi:hypothetical protein [Pseudarthrobacter sp. J47]|uniref:hypothetical protein n=1 Tax=Pseudarthrobacter sp. J47 TaxID=3116482 RepID=UPI002E7FDC70|nr:hypothetical protein [Pseudarthrobacter sp. J47]MEE2522982.1 hypothetical protein [Pseudarthrobacter sp. J47]
MSQEQPPLRSRRELRQLRAEAAPESGLTPRQQHNTGPRTDRVRRVSTGPVDSVPESGGERSSQIRARDRAALRAMKEQADREEPDFSSGPPTRRQMRLRQLQEQGSTAAVPLVPAPAADSRPGSSADSTADADSMTVEQALAARAEIAEQAKNHLARMDNSQGADPEAVDPRILKEQQALAERAALINRRTNSQPQVTESVPAATRPSDPAEASNLGMVTPLEFVKVPGVDRPVMKPPATSYVPVVTQPRPKLPPSEVENPESGSGRSWVIARAEAAARAAERPAGRAPVAAAPEVDSPAEQFFEEQAPIAASSAYGLDPLDAATAGLARAQRSKYVQYGVLAFGVLALVAGVILIISGMSR